MLPIEEKLDPRKRRTRQMLHTALMDLVAEKPLEDISVQNITARATLNRATFYDHFADKAALLEYSTRELFRAKLLEKLPTDAKLSAQNFTHLVECTCEFLEWFFGYCITKHQPSEPGLERQIKQALGAVLTGWFKETPSYPALAQVVPELNATMVAAALYAVAEHWVRGDRSLTVKEISNQLLLAVSGLMSVPKQ